MPEQLSMSQSSMPQRDELCRRLRAVLELVERNVARIGDYLAYWTSPDGAQGDLQDKIAAESALLVMLTLRVDGLPRVLRDLARTLGDHLCPLVRSPRHRCAIMRDPHRAATLGLGHLYLTSAGFRDPSWDELVQGMLSQGFGQIRERYPHRLLDRRWARSLVGLRLDVDETELVRLSIVGSRTHPIYMTRDDAYAYTHVLMYLSDFGRESIDAHVDMARVAEVIRACLAWTLLDEDFDLLGEFLLGTTLLGREWTPPTWFAWSVLTETWDRLGFLPGPGFDEAAFLRLHREKERQAYAFREMYHTNLVGGILCTTLLVQESRLAPSEPRVSVPRTLLQDIERGIHLGARYCRLGDNDYSNARPRGGKPRSLRGLIGQCLLATGVEREGRPVWAELAASDRHRHTATSVMLEALAIRCARDYDLLGLGRCLEDMTRSSEPMPLTLQEATRFILNQQVESGAIGVHLADGGRDDSSSARETTLAVIASLSCTLSALADSGE